MNEISNHLNKNRFVQSNQIKIGSKVQLRGTNVIMILTEFLADGNAVCRTSTPHGIKVESVDPANLVLIE